jgi:hypothetical protein
MGTVQQLRQKGIRTDTAKRLLALLHEVIDEDDSVYGLARQHFIDHFGPPESDKLGALKTIKETLNLVAENLERIGPLIKSVNKLVDELALPRKRTGTVETPQGPVTMTITDERA